MITLGNIELDKKQSIALIAGILIIFGAAGWYWFSGKSPETMDEAVTEDAALGELEEKNAAEETDMFADTGEDLFSSEEGQQEGQLEGGDEDLFALFDDETTGEKPAAGEEDMSDFFSDEPMDSTVVPMTETTGMEDTPAATLPPQEKMADANLETAKEKGNIIDLESKESIAMSKEATLPEGSIKDLLKKEGDVARVEVSNGKEMAVVEGEMKDTMSEPVPVVEKKPVPRTTYKVRRGDSFGSIARKLGYPVNFQTQLQFLAKNPSLFKGMAENEEGKLSLPVIPGQTLKLPSLPYKATSLYTQSGSYVTTYVIEFYGSENEASAELVRDALAEKGMHAYIRPFGRMYQVMIGFFTRKGAAEAAIKEAALYIGRSEDTINLMQLTRGKESYDDYVARERERYYIQLFASKSREQAQTLWEKVKKVQIKNSTMSEVAIKGENWYRIRTGYFNSEYEAVVEAKFLKRNIPEVKDFIIRKGDMLNK